MKSSADLLLTRRVDCFGVWFARQWFPPPVVDLWWLDVVGTELVVEVADNLLEAAGLV